MVVLQQASIRNYLLASLSVDDFGLLARHLEPVRLELHNYLFRAGETISHVVFPESGIISLVADIEEGRFEVGMAGYESVVGVPVVLGVEHTPHTALVQGAGEGLRMTALQLQSAMNQSPSLRSILLRFVHTFMVQVSQTAYANAAYDIEARLARWILMSHDRVDGDELVLTHEFMATMLGTGRPGVTFAVQRLEGNGLIRATRGRLTVRNRQGLEDLAGNSYGMAEREYTNVLKFEIKWKLE
jgi:CRP-like cAMP-binding protein